MDMAAAAPRYTITAIQAATCAVYGESPEELRGRGLHHPLVHRRQVAMALCRRLTDRSYPVIGMAFRRNHATVIHAERAVSQREATDRQLRAEMAEIVAIAGHLGGRERELRAAAALGWFLAQRPSLATNNV